MGPASERVFVVYLATVRPVMPAAAAVDVAAAVVVVAGDADCVVAASPVSLPIPADVAHSILCLTFVPMAQLFLQVQAATDCL